MRLGENYELYVKDLGRLKKTWTYIKNVSAWKDHVRLWGQLSAVEVKSTR